MKAEIKIAKIGTHGVKSKSGKANGEISTPGPSDRKKGGELDQNRFKINEGQNQNRVH